MQRLLFDCVWYPSLRDGGDRTLEYSEWPQRIDVFTSSSHHSTLTEGGTTIAGEYRRNEGMVFTHPGTGNEPMSFGFELEMDRQCYRNDLKLCFAAYAFTNNNRGTRCCVRCGMGTVLLEPMIKALSGSVDKEDAFKEARVELVEISTRNQNYSSFPKGVLTLKLRVCSTKRDSKGKLLVSFQTSDKGTSLLDSNQSTIQAKMRALYTKGFTDVGKRTKLDSTIRTICEPIHCPRFDMPPGKVIPGASYVLLARLGPERLLSPEFLESMLDTALSLHKDGTSTRESLYHMVADDDSFFKNQKEVMLLACVFFCGPAWAMEYISDYFNGNTARDTNFDKKKFDNVCSEIFKNTWLYLCGDCEDLAWVLMWVFWEVCESESSKKYEELLSSNKKHRFLLRLLQIVRKFYMGILAQWAVTQINMREYLDALARGQNPGRPPREPELRTSCSLPSMDKVSRLGVLNGYSKIPDDQILSHTIGVLSPKLYAKECMKRGLDLNREVVKGMPFLDPERIVIEHPEEEKQLPLLLLEGTYATSPLHPSLVGRDHKEHEEVCNAIFSNNPLMREHFSFMTSIGEDQNNRFYRMMIRGMSRYFYELYKDVGLKTCDVLFYYTDQNKYGVLGEDLLTKSPHVALFLYVLWDRKDEVIIDNLLREMEPCPQLNVPIYHESVPTHEDDNAFSRTGRSLLKAMKAVENAVGCKTDPSKPLNNPENNKHRLVMYIPSIYTRGIEALNEFERQLRGSKGPVLFEKNRDGLDVGYAKISGKKVYKILLESIGHRYMPVVESTDPELSVGLLVLYMDVALFEESSECSEKQKESKALRIVSRTNNPNNGEWSQQLHVPSGARSTKGGLICSRAPAFPWNEIS